MKTCTICSQPKPLDQFYGDKRAKDGKKVACKACHYIQLQASRKRNPEPSRAQCRKWRAGNKEKAASSSRNWHEKNKERTAELHRQWKAKHPERMKELLRVGRRNYKARKRAAEGTHTAEDVQRIYAAQRGRCACCRCKLGRQYHVDHIIALAAGGTNWPDNLQLTCATCNHSKKHKDPLVFMRQRGFLL